MRIRATETSPELFCLEVRALAKAGPALNPSEASGSGVKRGNLYAEQDQIGEESGKSGTCGQTGARRLVSLYFRVGRMSLSVMTGPDGCSPPLTFLFPKR